ncbi:hypothetical protein BDA96_10G067600 [Sorghum bicolor]|uniref:Uncharacterized protein n=1 Tax=Sorghum bicolor TaxID=4558 RepID=A0A921Q3D4_SORBI|nr:hypothetical protein BDA96_10G067600 [Sorghum bicolor]
MEVHIGVGASSGHRPPGLSPCRRAPGAEGGQGGAQGAEGRTWREGGRGGRRGPDAEGGRTRREGGRGGRKSPPPPGEWAQREGRGGRVAALGTRTRLFEGTRFLGRPGCERVLKTEEGQNGLFP